MSEASRILTRLHAGCQSSSSGLMSGAFQILNRLEVLFCNLAISTAGCQSTSSCMMSEASPMLTRLHVGNADCQSTSSAMMSGASSRILTRLPIHFIWYDVGGVILDTDQACCSFSPPGAVVGVPLGAKSTSLAMSDISPGRVVADCHVDFHGSVTGATSSSWLPSSL